MKRVSGVVERLAAAWNDGRRPTRSETSPSISIGRLYKAMAQVPHSLTPACGRHLAVHTDTAGRVKQRVLVGPDMLKYIQSSCMMCLFECGN
jgi:hypothetical protein